MNIIRYIYKREDKPRLIAQAHILVGYCPDTLEYFKKLTVILRKDFPDAKDNEIGCHKIHKSTHEKGFTLLAWRPKTEVRIWPDSNELETDEPLPDADEFNELTCRARMKEWWVRAAMRRDYYY